MYIDTTQFGVWAGGVGRQTVASWISSGKVKAATAPGGRHSIHVTDARAALVEYGFHVPPELERLCAVAGEDGAWEMLGQPGTSLTVFLNLDETKHDPGRVVSRVRIPLPLSVGEVFRVVAQLASTRTKACEEPSPAVSIEDALDAGLASVLDAGLASAQGEA